MTTLLLLLATLSQMPGDYEATKQVIHDQLPDGSTDDQTLEASGSIRIEPLAQPAPGQPQVASVYISYPGRELAHQTLTDLGDGRVRIYETNPVYGGCEPTIEVRPFDTGYEFTMQDVKFPDYADVEYCLSIWPYPLQGTYRWSFDPAGKRAEVLLVGDFQDMDGVKKHRTILLGFDPAGVRR